MLHLRAASPPPYDLPAQPPHMCTWTCAPGHVHLDMCTSTTWGMTPPPAPHRASPLHLGQPLPLLLPPLRLLRTSRMPFLRHSWSGLTSQVYVVCAPHPSRATDMHSHSHVSSTRHDQSLPHECPPSQAIRPLTAYMRPRPPPDASHTSPIR